MTTKDQLEKDAPVSTTPKDNDAESSEIKRELTDEEIAAVAGGLPGAGAGHGASPQPVLGPTKPPGSAT